MKENLKRFYEYLDTDEELMYYVRINAEWSEESFCEMKRLAEAIMEDYAEEDTYPKGFIYYFTLDIPSIINIISHFRGCSYKNLLEGYTDETYRSMIADKIKQLKEFEEKFISSCGMKESLKNFYDHKEKFISSCGMKESLKNFYDYVDSEEELLHSVSMNAEWNEESFCKMKRLIRAVMEAYVKEEGYPKKVVLYHMRNLPSVVNILSQLTVCTEKYSLEGYTDETYRGMLADKIKELHKLKWEFDHYLGTTP